MYLQGKFRNYGLGIRNGVVRGNDYAEILMLGISGFRNYSTASVTHRALCHVTQCPCCHLKFQLHRLYDKYSTVIIKCYAQIGDFSIVQVQASVISVFQKSLILLRLENRKSPLCEIIKIFELQQFS